MEKARGLLQQGSRAEQNQLGRLLRDHSEPLVAKRSRSGRYSLRGNTVRFVNDQEPDVFHFLKFVQGGERDDVVTPVELLLEMKFVRQLATPLTGEGLRNHNRDAT